MKPAFLHQLDQARTGLFPDRMFILEAFHQPREFLFLQRQLCGRHDDALMRAALGRHLQRRLHADDRQLRIQRAQLIHTGAGRRIARDDDGLDPAFDHMRADIDAQPADIRAFPDAVGRMGAVPIIQEMLMR